LAIEYNSGKSLIETLESLNMEERNSETGLRLSILASYVDRGVYAMGKIERGTLSRGTQVCVSPTLLKCTIVDILVDEVSVKTAKCGENVCVKVKGGEIQSEADVQKGFVLSDIKIGCKQFTATIRLLELLEHRPVFTAGYQCVLHCHTIAEEAVVDKILWKHHVETGEPLREKCTYAKVGDTITVRITVTQSIAVDVFNECAPLGRITLRDEGKSIAIGKIKKLE